MPHLHTEAGIDLDIDLRDDGTAHIGIAPHSLADVGLAGIELTPAEARMVGGYLAAAAPAPVDGAELRARAAAPARAKVYDPAATMPADWLELATYARHLARKGLEVTIVVAADIPELYDLDENTTGGTPGVIVRVDETVPPPGRYDIARNGQRIASYHLGAKAPR